MNELSSLCLESPRAKYKIGIDNLSPVEYRILLFAIEHETRNYNSHDKYHRDFESLKQKLIDNHKMFNVQQKKEEAL